MISDATFLKNLCKKNEVNYDLARRLKERIFPLLENAHQRLGYRFDKAFVEQRKGIDVRLANSRVLSSVRGKLSPQFFSLEERKAITLHLEYLPLIEAIFATQVDFLAFILIANGHDLFFCRKGQYVERLNDIEEVNLAHKLKFLRRHGLGIVANKANIKLRNSIAHLFYNIDKDGTIRFGRKRITQASYESLYDKLRDVSLAVHLVTLTYYRRFA